MAKAFKIGDALDSIFETANNIASKAKSVDYSGIYTDLKEAAKQTDEELANIARATLMNNINGDTKVPASKIQEIARNTGVTDANFNKKVRELTSAMKKQDLSEAHKIASEIDKNYQSEQKTFQDLVISADISINNTLQKIRDADTETIAGKWKKNFKRDMPEYLKNFTTNSNRDKIANFAYHAQGAKKYFSTDDPSINQKRLGIVAGGYIAATSGMRIINGGTPITNEYGERDIAGIPFI